MLLLEANDSKARERSIEMTNNSRRKRKIHNVDKDGESDENDISSSDDFSPDDSDSIDEDYLSSDAAKKKGKKTTQSALNPRKKRTIAESDTAKTPKKKENKKIVAKEIRSVKNAAIKVENDDDIIEKTPGESKKKKKKGDTKTTDSFDLVLPSSIIKGGGSTSDNQCTLLVEVSDPKDAIALGEFGGSIGAIGRFESDPNGITLDLKGNQYRGSILPGPTCLVVGFPQSFGARKKDPTTDGETVPEDDDDDEARTLRVEGIVDEYATLVQIDDHMKKLDAVVIENSNEANTGAQDL